MRIEPTIPKDWPGFDVLYKHGSTTYEISIQTPEKTSRVLRKVVSLTVDGVSYDPATGFTLLNDGKTHQVKVVMGTKAL